MADNNSSKANVEVDKQFWDYFDSGSLYNASLSIQQDGISYILGLYAALMCTGALGNIVVLSALARAPRRSRVALLMIHLAIADVFVACVVIPLEIIWKATNQWLAGNFCCKLLLVLRVFGLYLSSNMLVCISIDRLFAVLYPLRLASTRRRIKKMLWLAWGGALACSLPQGWVFRLKEHPTIPSFTQCVSFDAFRSPRQETAYTVFCLSAMYFGPLIVITACYIRIFLEVYRSSMQMDGNDNGLHLRRSDGARLRRARRRTLRMTVTIVSVFALCWLPYVTICMWYMLDRESAHRISSNLQNLLFAMAVSNSCVNPLVYGTYCLNIRERVQRLCKLVCCKAASAADTIGTSGSSSVRKNVRVDQRIVQSTNVQGRRRLGMRFADMTLTAAGGDVAARAPVRRPPARLQCVARERNRVRLEINNYMTTCV